jgi:methyltransferase (TIGR00027 family)
VRNPDWVAERLIGPAELDLITDHPISKALERDFQEAINAPDIFGFAWLMLVRTRFIDERMERAIRNGATQLVILGAGFDTRAHRFSDLLKEVRVIEIDYGATQEYKQRRVEAALGGPSASGYLPRLISHGKTSARCCAAPDSSPHARPITSARASACTSRKKG